MSRPFERAYVANRYAFRVRTDMSDLGADLAGLLAPFGVADHADGSTPTYVIRRRAGDLLEVLLDGEVAVRASSVASIRDWVLWDVNAKAIESVTEHVAVHAGAASFEGRAVLLPAPPDHGKTTTVAGLTRAGFSYLTDEAALIGLETGLVHPYPRPLWMEPPSVEVVFGRAPAVQQTYFQFRPDDLRPGAVGAASPVAFVVAPAYALGAKTELRPMTRAEALTLLCHSSFNLESLGSRGFEALAGVVRGAECYRLTIGDLAGAVGAVAGLFRAA